jgi:glutamine synthetase
VPEPVGVSSNSTTRTIRAASKAFATRGISELPRTLDEAVKAFAADPFVEEILGSELRNKFITYKSEE